MKVYNYNRETGEYTGTTSAKPDPAEQGRWLVPANATTIELPALIDGQIAVFNGESWDAVADHRGKTVWNTDTVESAVVQDFGPLPKEWTTEDPGKLTNPVWSGGKWVEDRDKALELTLSKIEQNFQSKASEPYVYNGHEYESDYIAVQGMAQMCYSETTSAALPTKDGRWTTTAVAPDGVTPVKVAFTCGQFLTFSAALTARRSDLFDEKQAEEIKAREMFVDPEKSASDLVEFVITKRK